MGISGADAGGVHFAVPIFFMVSGMNLLDYRKKYSTKVFLKNVSCGWGER